MSRIGDAEGTAPDSLRASDSTAAAAERHRSDALYLYALARSRAFRATTIPGVSRIRYRDIDAIVKPGTFAAAEIETSTLSEHQRVVEAAMRGATVLPMPCGIVFRDRRELIRWMEDQYLALNEALSFLDGHWELRIHMTVRRDVDASADIVDLAAHAWAELRRIAHAALPLARTEGRLFSAAFLVRRSDWVEFVERAEDLVSVDARLSLDVTGPWPAYDFVRIAR